MSRNNMEILAKVANEGYEISDKKVAESLLRGKIHLKCKNPRQKKYAKMIEANQITLCTGPAGVGKSYISVVKALDLLRNPNNGYSKVIIITPVVESEEKIGYLKGSLADKLDPYLFSTYYLIDKVIGKENREKLVELEIIKPLAIAYLRGVNIDRSIVLFEEAQNSTTRAMKTVLTRIGFDSKFIISGDIEQIDRFKNENDSGLKDALGKLESVDDVGIMEFENQDVVRNPLISKILDQY